MRKQNEFEEDDNRTIADMSGVQRPRLFGGLFSPLFGKERSIPEVKVPETEDEKPEMLPEEKKWYVLGAIKAALVIAFVYIGVLGALILLLLYMWGVL
ncbi:MAG: hypothetical protein J1E65_05765 [Lachnospiraceae bacterium]|nr:hypothetical protein [Lachnospiraceae bacterium]